MEIKLEGITKSYGGHDGPLAPLAATLAGDWEMVTACNLAKGGGE